MRCTHCGSENTAAMQFCEECGTKLVPACPNCGREVRATAKFCGACGTALVGASHAPSREASGQIPADVDLSTVDLSPQTLDARGERRQLTVLFCDLVGSTALSTHLDPEDLREVIRHYQQTCAAVIQRHDGHIAQYLGDGLLVYFGYPTAHEDDARRAVRAGLEIIDAIREQVTRDRLPKEQKLQVRIGIHTGLVVIGDIGTSGRTEQLAVGETPNIAARIQSLADPSTVIISAATHRVVDGQFDSQPFGSHLLKGIDVPIAVYHVQSERQSTSLLVGKTALTPLVGREQEVGLLIDRWEQAKEGRGQVVLLSGEPGIGKSRLAYTLREHVTAEGSLLFEARCSPYHQHSAFYPLIDVLQRTLLLTQQDSESEKVNKLERALTLYNMQETVPLFASLLSLPAPHSALPAFTPQKQKERTLHALVQLLLAQAERQATVSVWEDLHWADPSSLEFLSLLIEQIPTTNVLLVLTFRPEFVPPWKPRSHISQLVLNRLGKKHVETMIEKVTTDNALSAEMIEQIRVKTDGVPLFVEELTKSVMESVHHGGTAGTVLAIPATLQETLLARLDRLSEARQVAQLGATIGREFSHELIQAVAPLSEEDVHTALDKLVEAEIVYQRGIGEQARYFFKHALIQDTAYQSLLKSTRQQYHQQIAHVLEERFAQTKETQPELLAHHYTEAGLIEQAIPHWRHAGEHATHRSAYVEATAHFTRGLALIQTLPVTQELAQQELPLQLALGAALVATQGFTTQAVEDAYSRARELCRMISATEQLFPVLWGLWDVFMVRGQLQTARELAEQLLALAQQERDPLRLLQAHYALGVVVFQQGSLALALVHFEQANALYAPHHHSRLTSLCSFDPGVSSLTFTVLTLWALGYVDRALTKSEETLVLARTLDHPFSFAQVLVWTSWFHQLRRDEAVAQEFATDAMRISAEQGYPHWLALGTIRWGIALAGQEKIEEGIRAIQQGLAAIRASGTEALLPHYLIGLAHAHARLEQSAEGLNVLAHALAHIDNTGDRLFESEVYRLKGELTLQQESKEQKAEISEQKAEECFLKAIHIAQQQHAKSLELRAATSLARLWQQQGKRAEAHKLLSEVYNWFTEGFDTKDLQEAKALLAELAYEATINYHK